MHHHPCELHQAAVGPELFCGHAEVDAQGEQAVCGPVLLAGLAVLEEHAAVGPEPPMLQVVLELEGMHDTRTRTHEHEEPEDTVEERSREETADERNQEENPLELAAEQVEVEVGAQPAVLVHGETVAAEAAVEQQVEEAARDPAVDAKANHARVSLSSWRATDVWSCGCGSCCDVCDVTLTCPATAVWGLAVEGLAAHCLPANGAGGLVASPDFALHRKTEKRIATWLQEIATANYSLKTTAMKVESSSIKLPRSQDGIPTEQSEVPFERPTETVQDWRYSL